MVLLLFHYFLLRWLARPAKAPAKAAKAKEEPSEWCRDVLLALKCLDLPKLLRSFQSPQLCNVEASALLLPLGALQNPKPLT